MRHRGRIAVVRVAGVLLMLAAAVLAIVPANAQLAGKPVYCNGVPPFFIGAPSDPGAEGVTPKDNACMDASFTRVGWAMLVGLLGVGAVGATVWVTRRRKTATRTGGDVPIVCASKREYVRVDHRGWAEGLGRVTRPRMWLLAVSVSVFSVAACAASPGTGAASGRPAAAAIDLDGQFHAAPVANQNPTIPGSRALEVLSLQYNRGVTSYRHPILARVTWSAKTAQSPIGPVPVRQDAEAWVLVFTELSAAPPCPIGTRAPVPSGVGSGSNAVIVDARTGAAAIYDGGSPGCGGLSTPTVSAAGRYWSIPWTPAPDGQLARVTVPACGVLAGSTGINDVLYMVAETPLDGPCSGSPRTVVSNDAVLAPSGAYTTHGPTGPLCADFRHTRYPLPPVPGCVLGRNPPRP